jgi:hypothetical protein
MIPAQILVTAGRCFCAERNTLKGCEGLLKEDKICSAVREKSKRGDDRGIPPFQKWAPRIIEEYIPKGK